MLALGPTRAGTLQRNRRRRAGGLGGPVPQRAGNELPHLRRSRRRPRRRGVIGVARTRVLNPQARTVVVDLKGGQDGDQAPRPAAGERSLSLAGRAIVRLADARHVELVHGARELGMQSWPAPDGATNTQTRSRPREAPKRGGQRDHGRALVRGCRGQRCDHVRFVTRFLLMVKRSTQRRRR